MVFDAIASNSVSAGHRPALASHIVHQLRLLARHTGLARLWSAPAVPNVWPPWRDGGAACAPSIETLCADLDALMRVSHDLIASAE